MEIPTPCDTPRSLGHPSVILPPANVCDLAQCPAALYHPLPQLVMLRAQGVWQAWSRAEGRAGPGPRGCAPPNAGQPPEQPRLAPEPTPYRRRGMWRTVVPLLCPWPLFRGVAVMALGAPAMDHLHRPGGTSSGGQNNFLRLQHRHFPPKSQIGQRRVRQLWGVWRGGGGLEFEQAAPLKREQGPSKRARRHKPHMADRPTECTPRPMCGLLH